MTEPDPFSYLLVCLLAHFGGFCAGPRRVSFRFLLAGVTLLFHFGYFGLGESGASKNKFGTIFKDDPDYENQQYCRASASGRHRRRVSARGNGRGYRRCAGGSRSTRLQSRRRELDRFVD